MTAPVWNEDRVQNWLSKLAMMEAELAPVSDVLFESAALQPGMDVLDVGCGGGSTTRRAAGLVVPDGSATGLDISPTMVEAADRLSADHPIRWIAKDLSREALAEASYDVVMSRFGVMFFADRLAAFRRLAAATRTGGRLCLAVWRRAGEVPLFDVPYDAVVAMLGAHGIHLEAPASPGSSLGHPVETRRLLEEAGWSDVSFRTSEVPLYPGGPLALDDVLQVALTQGPVRALLEGQPESTIDLARAALRQELTPRYDGIGVPLDGGFMIISATRR